MYYFQKRNITGRSPYSRKSHVPLKLPLDCLSKSIDQFLLWLVGSGIISVDKLQNTLYEAYAAIRDKFPSTEARYRSSFHTKNISNCWVKINVKKKGHSTRLGEDNHLVIGYVLICEKFYLFSLCTAAPSHQEKSGERDVCVLPLIIVFRGHVNFSRISGKWYDWLILSDYYIMQIAHFNWLTFSQGFISGAQRVLLQSLPSCAQQMDLWIELYFMRSL